MSLIYNEMFRYFIPIILFEQGKDRQVFKPGNYSLSKNMIKKVNQCI